MIVLSDLKILSSELGPVRYSDGRTVLRCVKGAYTLKEGMVCGLAFVQGSLVLVLVLFILHVVYCGRHHLLSSMQMLMMSLPQPTQT